MRIAAMLFFVVCCLSVMGQQNYRVGPGDLVKVSVIELEEVENQYRIDNMGNLTLPYLGRVAVKGKTLSELQRSITEQLKEGYVNDPHVFVDVLEYNYQPISVIGAVKIPGKLNRVDQNINLIEAITRAGGVMENASDKIFIMRKTPEGLSETLEISYDELMIQGRSYLNIPIYFGDTINIPVERPLVVSVIGEVNRPGEYKFTRDSRITILRVIAAAGGFTDYAKQQKLVIKREVGARAQKFTVNVRAIQDSGEEDFLMEHNDVVIVP